MVIVGFRRIPYIKSKEAWNHCYAILFLRTNSEFSVRCLIRSTNEGSGNSDSEERNSPRHTFSNNAPRAEIRSGIGYERYITLN